MEAKKVITMNVGKTMSKMSRSGMKYACALWVSTVGLTTTAAYAVSDLPGGPAVRQYNLHPAVTKVAEDQGWLHWYMLAICLVIFVGVFGVILKHRKSVGHKPANFHESTAVEIAWTVVPFLIVIAMALPATKAVVSEKDTTNADLTIKATGMQWKWGYDYITGEGQGLAVLSTLDNSQRILSNAGGPKAGDAADDYLLRVDHPLVVPVNKKIRIITTANDVIHAFMVPAFGINQDAIPGFVRDTWFRADKVGDFYGQCSKLCGKEHSYMPIHVKVVSAADYTAWVAGKNKEAAAKADDPSKIWTLADIKARGEKVYAANCAACHQVNGKGAGPIKPLDGSAIVLDADHGKQIAILLNGANNGAMPSWKALSDTDLAAVISYTKNNWSNQTGQLVQPAELQAARK
jgi:cytochrome c oxidase subunit II